MKIKNPTQNQCIILILAIIVSLTTVGCKHYAESITKVLQQDKETEGIKDDGQRIKQMRDIDLSECPEDFRGAYVDNIHAWEDAAPIDVALAQLQSKSVRDDATLAGILATLFNSEKTPYSDWQDAIEGLKQKRREASDKINDTWKIVENIAVKYGGKLTD